MSKKYVIEIKPEYEDSFKGLMLLGAKDSNLFVDTLAVENLEQYIPVDVEKIYDKAYGDGYNKGFEDGKNGIGKGCEGCKWESRTAIEEPCKYCSNCHTSKYTPIPKQDGRIEVGDIVERYVDGKLDSKGVYLQEESGYWWRCLFDTDGVLMTFAYPKGQFKKTGKHCDIKSILEAIRA